MKAWNGWFFLFLLLTLQSAHAGEKWLDCFPDSGQPNANISLRVGTSPKDDLSPYKYGVTNIWMYKGGESVAPEQVALSIRGNMADFDVGDGKGFFSRDDTTAQIHFGVSKSDEYQCKERPAQKDVYILECRTDVAHDFNLKVEILPSGRVYEVSFKRPLPADADWQYLHDAGDYLGFQVYRGNGTLVRIPITKNLKAYLFKGGQIYSCNPNEPH